MKNIKNKEKKLIDRKTLINCIIIDLVCNGKIQKQTKEMFSAMGEKIPKRYLTK